MSRPAFYAEDLAFVHHAGFTGYVRSATPGLLALLRRADIGRGTVLDLDCGSGVWLRRLAWAGYDAVTAVGEVPADPSRHWGADRATRRYGAFEVPERRLVFEARKL